MKKLITAIDLFVHLLILLLGTAFLVYQNNFFAGQMMWICWLPFTMFTTFNLASFCLKKTPNFKQSVFSILNICFLCVLLAINKLILIEFFLSAVLGELVAVPITVSYFFLFRKGLNDQTAMELFGKGGAILLAIFFTAITYPYIGEAAIYVGEKGVNIYLLVAFVATLLFSVNGQIKTISNLVAKRKTKPGLVYKELSIALDKSTSMGLDTKVILISLGLWFVGIGAVWVVYSYNA